MVQPRIGEGETVGMMVRMPADLRDRIKVAAEANGRSQNSEIVATLAATYPEPEHGEFAQMMVRFVRLHADATKPEEKQAIYERFREYTERTEPGMTVRLWFGMPMPMPIEEAEKLDARGPSFMARIARRFSRTSSDAP